MVPAGGPDPMVISMTLLKGLTPPDGEVDQTGIFMTLSSGVFNLQDGPLVRMDICMTLQKGSMRQDGVVDLMAIFMILQKET